MLIVFGQKNYGKVDHVPGLFHVVTEFFHLYYVPLIPLKSYLVLDEAKETDSFQRTPISMSLRSVLMGWFRALLFCAFIAGLLIGGTALAHYLENQRQTPVETFVIPFVVAVVSIFLYWLSVRLARASYERALVIAEQAGLAPEHVEKSFQPQQDSFDEYDQSGQLET